MSIAAFAASEAHDDQEWGEPQEYSLLDRDGREREFTGWLVDSESTEQDSVSRWTVLEGYKTVGGNYVLHVIGCSVIYHRAESPCNTGEPVLGRDMEPGLEPCRKCRPPAGYARMPEEIFSVEVDIPTVKVSETPAKFIKSLHFSSGGTQAPLSLVAFRLLRAMQRKDPEIQAELQRTSRRVA